MRSTTTTGLMTRRRKVSMCPGKGRDEMETRTPYPLSFHMLEPRHLLAFPQPLRPPTFYAKCFLLKDLLTGSHEYTCTCRQGAGNQQRPSHRSGHGRLRADAAWGVRAAWQGAGVVGSVGLRVWLRRSAMLLSQPAAVSFVLLHMPSICKCFRNCAPPPPDAYP